MTNNDVIKRLRYALSIPDRLAVRIFKLAGVAMTEEEFQNMLVGEYDDNYKKCNNALLMNFLDGLITLKRGPSKGPAVPVKITKNNLNNMILRKLKIALEFQSDDMIKVFHLGGVELSSSELSALFRKEGHKNYRECGDKYIRVFIKGLTAMYREDANK